jgi:Subtilisin-like serine proteases
MIEADFGDILHSDKIVVYNDNEKTCFHVPAIAMEATKLRNITSASFQSDYDIVPMTDIMKITVNTFAEISHDTWSFSTSDLDRNKEGQWERMIRVAFTVGNHQALTDSEVMSLARDIVSSAQSLGRVGAEHRRLVSDSKSDGTHRLLSTQKSLIESFSLTSSTIQLSRDDNTRRLLDVLTRGRAERFIMTAQNGLEADHGCQSMFDRMEIRSHDDKKGFDIVLNPIFGQNSMHNDSAYDDEASDNSSASNLDCIVSFVMALSTHSSVLNVEVDSAPTFDDYDAKWITQSKQQGQTPLSDAGLTGRGQIVSVIDSGVQPDHRFFGPTSATTIDNWDMEQRKIVSYYTYYGDDQDAKNGHGTAVAGILVGKAMSGNTDANGIAEDAKLHVVDVSNGGLGIYVPGSPSRLFAAMYNGGDGAKIANGSFSTMYSVYRTSCRMYDNDFVW